MSLPTTRLALPHVGGSGNQRPDPAACPDPKVRGMFRRGQSGQWKVRAHDVQDLQRRHLSALSQATAASTHTGPAHDPGSRQRSISSRHPPASLSAPQRTTPAAAVPAPLQPATRPDRAGLEAGPPLGNAQSLLRSASRCTRRRQRLLRSLAQTEQRIASPMLHYLGRCV